MTTDKFQNPKNPVTYLSSLEHKVTYQGIGAARTATQLQQSSNFMNSDKAKRMLANSDGLSKAVKWQNDLSGLMHTSMEDYINIESALTANNKFPTIPMNTFNKDMRYLEKFSPQNIGLTQFDSPFSSLAKSYQTPRIPSLADLTKKVSKISPNYGGLSDAMNHLNYKSAIFTRNPLAYTTSESISRRMAKNVLGVQYNRQTRDKWGKIIDSNYVNHPSFNASLNAVVEKNTNKEINDYTPNEQLSVAATEDLLKNKIAGAPSLKLSSEELYKLQSFLSRTPALALNNETARKLYNYYSSVKVEKQYIKDRLFHGRSRSLFKRKTPFVQDELESTAPWGLPSQGRFNIANQNLYYASDDMDSLASELKLQDGEVFDAIEFETNEKLGVLDLTNGDQNILSFCLQKVSSGSNARVEYQIPGFITQCLQCNKDIQVIKIKSAVSDTATNYIFLNPSFRDYMNQDNVNFHLSRK
ncbi:hypothetical protein [Lactiplantibacillus songbeiensis]|uniref:RES domain-containing protein n=1 Tax=Lactiplantibacillus songbeiensis TaxID=2559920 RepID=A0ABW4C079_9LACO|nr:hypothetical protein [Lactiplantibacillus songbeiensis]